MDNDAFIEQCIRLASENKITSKNPWSLRLIDGLKEAADQAFVSRQSADGFSQISRGIDASVKIYSYRVDDTLSVTYKVAAGLTSARADSASDGGAAQREAARARRAAAAASLNYLAKLSDISTEITHTFVSDTMSAMLSSKGLEGGIIQALAGTPGQFGRYLDPLDLAAAPAAPAPAPAPARADQLLSEFQSRSRSAARVSDNFEVLLRFAADEELDADAAREAVARERAAEGDSPMIRTNMNNNMNVDGENVAVGGGIGGLELPAPFNPVWDDFTLLDHSMTAASQDTATIDGAAPDLPPLVPLNIPLSPGEVGGFESQNIHFDFNFDIDFDQSQTEHDMQGTQIINQQVSEPSPEDGAAQKRVLRTAFELDELFSAPTAPRNARDRGAARKAVKQVDVLPIFTSLVDVLSSRDSSSIIDTLRGPPVAHRAATAQPANDGQYNTADSSIPCRTSVDCFSNCITSFASFRAAVTNNNNGGGYGGADDFDLGDDAVYDDNDNQDMAMPEQPAEHDHHEQSPNGTAGGEGAGIDHVSPVHAARPGIFNSIFSPNRLPQTQSRLSSLLLAPSLFKPPAEVAAARVRITSNDSGAIVMPAHVNIGRLKQSVMSALDIHELNEVEKSIMMGVSVTHNMDDSDAPTVPEGTLAGPNPDEPTVLLPTHVVPLTTVAARLPLIHTARDLRHLTVPATFLAMLFIANENHLELSPDYDERGVCTDLGVDIKF